MFADAIHSSLNFALKLKRLFPLLSFNLFALSCLSPDEQDEQRGGTRPYPHVVRDQEDKRRMRIPHRFPVLLISGKNIFPPHFLTVCTICSLSSRSLSSLCYVSVFVFEVGSICLQNHECLQNHGAARLIPCTWIQYPDRRSTTREYRETLCVQEEKIISPELPVA